MDSDVGSESKRKEYYEKPYTPDNYIDEFERTTQEKLPVTVIFHLIEVTSSNPIIFLFISLIPNL